MPALGVVSMAVLLLAGEGEAMKVEEALYGKTPSGEEVRVYTLANKNGLKARVISWGAIVTELQVPDRSGKPADVVLGFEKLEDWLKNPAYFGCVVGRVANRIAKGKFRLEGKEYTLATNNAPNHLHGGDRGIDKRAWKSEVVPGPVPAVKLSYRSPDGEEGYPGNLDVTVTYSL